MTVPHRPIQSLVCAGRITHHEEVSRLKKVYELVKEARQQVEGGPCMQQLLFTSS